MKTDAVGLFIMWCGMTRYVSIVLTEVWCIHAITQCSALKRCLSGRCCVFTYDA